MKSNLLKTTLGVVGVAALAAYWYWSPFITLWQMRSAVDQRDATAFSQHVDYPRLRASLKAQFAILYADLPGAPDTGGAQSGAAAAFGKKLGLLVVDKFADLMVRPETVMLALQRGYMERKPLAAPRPAQGAGGKPEAALADPADPAPRWIYLRTGVNQLVVYRSDVAPTDVTAMERFRLVFERGGFASWKLAGVALPGAAP